MQSGDPVKKRETEKNPVRRTKRRLLFVVKGNVFCLLPSTTLDAFHVPNPHKSPPKNLIQLRLWDHN